VLLKDTVYRKESFPSKELDTKPEVCNRLLLPATLLLFILSTVANELKLYLWDTAKCQPTQNTFKHKLHIHSVTLCDITIQIVTHRVDWFSCLAFVWLQYTPARLPNLIFQITHGQPQISLSKGHMRPAAGCAPLHKVLTEYISRLPRMHHQLWFK